MTVIIVLGPILCLSALLWRIFVQIIIFAPFHIFTIVSFILSKSIACYLRLYTVRQ